MKITAITLQTRNKNRINVSVDGKYKFSLDTYQLVELGLKVGTDYSESDIIGFEQESQFGKLYSRALEYCLIRPHSAREVKDYLYRKTRQSLSKTGELQPGYQPEMTTRVFDRLIEKKYIDDSYFAKYWVENRFTKKGISRRKLISELHSKGISNDIIENVLSETTRDDSEEIKKVIKKKKSRYPDKQKFISYLAGLGYRYEEIKQELNKIE